MSFIQPAAISAIAHSVDVPRLSDEAAKALAPDVEYRLREIVQEAQKFAKHAKRTVVTTEDIKQALRLRNADPVYGFCSTDPARYLKVSGHPELFYVKDPDLTFHQLIDAPLPPPPRDMGLAMHWLAVGGVQPRIPQNEPLPAEQLPQQKKRPRGQGKDTGRMVVARGADATAVTAGRSAAAAAAAAGGGGAGGAAASGVGAAGAAAGSAPQAVPAPAPAHLGPGTKVEVQGPIRHLVPKELWVYYDKLVGLLTSHPAAVTPVTSAPSAAGGSGLGGPGGSSISRVRWEAPPAATSSMPLGHLPSLTSSQPLPSLPSGAASSSRPLPAAAGAPPAAAAAGASAARSHAAMVRAALASVSSDTGLHPLTPYFVNFIAEGVRKHVGDLEVLPRLLGLARALLANKDLHLAPYLKQLLPAVMTALLTSPLGASPLAPSAAVRDLAASVLAQICERFSAPYHNVQPQVCRVLLAAWQDPAKALDTKYGAVVGLAALGPAVVSNLLLPSLEPQLTKTVLPALATLGPSGREGGPDEAAPMEEDGATGQAAAQARAQQRHSQQLKQAQAWQLFGALLEAVGSAMYSQVMGRVRDALPLDMLMRREARKAADWDDVERALAAQVAADKAATAVLEARQRPLKVLLVAVPLEHQPRFPGRLVVLQIKEQVDSSKKALQAAKQRAQEAAASIAATRRAWRQHQQQGAGGSTTADGLATAGSEGPTAMDIDGLPAAGANGHMPVASKPVGSSSKQTKAAAKAEAGAAAAGGGEAGDLGLPQLSAVLAESWKEDSDVGATLDALSHVFGERLLPFMPLFHLPSCNL